MLPQLAAYRVLLRSITAGEMELVLAAFTVAPALVAVRFKMAFPEAAKMPAAFKGDAFMLQQSKREVRHKYQVKLNAASSALHFFQYSQPGSHVSWILKGLAGK